MLKVFWEWVRPSLEGDDGTASHRRLTVLHCMLVLTFMVIAVAVWGVVFPEIAWLVFAGGAGIFSGLSAWQSKINQTNNETSNKNNKSSSFTDA